jgi:hypothetical protein
MATIQQGASGNFSDTSTWVGGVVPTAGDNVVSHGGFILNMDVSANLGASAQSGGWPNSFNAANTAAPSAAIWMRQGTLTIADNVSLTLKGDFISMDSNTTIGAGVTITIDPTNADVSGNNAAGASLATGAADVGANKFYVIDIGMGYSSVNTKGRLTINGTEANPTTIQCVDGGTSFFLAGRTMSSISTHSSGCIDATYTHFKNFGAIPALLATAANYDGTLLKEKGFNRNQIIRAFIPRLTSEGTNTTHANDIKFSMVRCVLEDTTGIQPQYDINDDGSRAQITFEYVRAKASKYWLRDKSFINLAQTLDVSEAVTNTSLKVTANVTPFRRMKNCSWDRAITWGDGAAGWEIENNVFACGLDMFGWIGHGAISFRGNIVVRSRIFGLPAAKAEYTLPAEWDVALASFYNDTLISYARRSFQKIPYGTGKRDPSIPAAIRTAFGDSTTAPFTTASGRMGIGSYIKDNYFLEDNAESNPHTLSMSGGIGDGAHLVIDNIWELGDNDGQGEYIITTADFNAERATELTSGGAEGTHKTGAVYLAGNMNVPSKNGTEASTFFVSTPSIIYPAGWQGPNASGGDYILASNYVDASYQVSAGSNQWWLGHFPHIYTNNTFFTGVSEGAMNLSEHGYHKDILRYAKNNIFWDSAVRTNVVWSVGDVSNRVYPDLVIPENLNNNIKINQYGTAHTTGGYNFTTETVLPNVYYGQYFNANGYRGLDLSNPTTSVTYTPLADPSTSVTVERRNYFGRDDAEISTTVNNLPFVNYLSGTPRYALSVVGVATNAEAWQLISKEHDWTDADQLNGMTRAGLLAFVRDSMAPVRTSNGFTSALNDVDANPDKYYDPEMTTGGNPLGNYGELPYVATDDANKGLVAINAIYQTAGAEIGALAFTDTNRLPVAVNDGIIAVTKNVSKSILISTLLGNDSDPDGDNIRISSFTQGSKGTVSKTTTHIVYAPTAEETGTDTFTYTVSDLLGKSSTATVTLNIASSAPIAVNHTNPNGVGNAFLTITKASLLAGATDADGNDANITFNGFSTRSAQATSDNIQAVGDDNIGYQAPTGVTGVDSFTYTVIDEDGDIGQGTYTIVLAAPAGGGGGDCAPIGDPKAVVYIDLQTEAATSEPFTLQPSQELELFVSPRLRANEFVILETKGSSQEWSTLGTIINEDDTSGVTINSSRVPREYRVIKSVTQLTTRVESN